MAIATDMAANSPMAVAGSKEMLNFSRDHSVKDSLTYMATWQAGMFQQADLQESLMAQQQKRAPEYAPLHNKHSRMQTASKS